MPCPQVARDEKEEPFRIISLFPLGGFNMQISDFMNADLLPTAKHTIWLWYRGRMPQMLSSKHFQISIKFTPIHPHQRKRLFFWKERQQYVLCIPCLQQAKRKRGMKGSQSRKWTLAHIGNLYSMYVWESVTPRLQHTSNIYVTNWSKTTFSRSTVSRFKVSSFSNTDVYAQYSSSGPLWCMSDTAWLNKKEVFLPYNIEIITLLGISN